MTRIALMITFSLTLLFLVKEMVTTLQYNDLTVETTTDAKRGKGAAQGRPQPVTLYPVVPGVLPDLGKGYLFNEERSLNEGRPAGQDHEAIAVNIDEVTYEGSLIVGEDRIALLSYPERGQQTIRTSRIARRTVSTKETGHIRVRMGETISGYKVLEILPEKIIFSKGAERLEKVLFDASKQRVVADRPSPTRQSPTMSTPVPSPNPRSNPPPAPPKNADNRINMIRRAPPQAPPVQDTDPGDPMINSLETGR